jgi:predicted DsbA family dithiol-disulfide isomerase
MLIEIWSDVVCPWCYIGKRRLEAALATFAHSDEVEIRYRSFQLDPTAKRSAPDDEPGVAKHLAGKYGMGIAQAEEMVEHVTRTAAGEGLEFHQDRCLGRDTMDAHRLLHAAFESGGSQLQAAVKERFLRAYFTEGQRIDDQEVLRALALEAGMEADLVDNVLAGDRHADDVRADQADAASLGANGVPFFVVDRRIGVSGAQPVEVFTQLLEQAWSQRQPITVLAGSSNGSDGAEACGPDGCAI